MCKCAPLDDQGQRAPAADALLFPPTEPVAPLLLGAAPPASHHLRAVGFTKASIDYPTSCQEGGAGSPAEVDARSTEATLVSVPRKWEKPGPLGGKATNIYMASPSQDTNLDKPARDCFFEQRALPMVLTRVPVDPGFVSGLGGRNVPAPNIYRESSCGSEPRGPAL
jgi:hypothetical protein